MRLNEFLAKAKANTYASIGEGGEKKFPDGGRELVFEENGFKYRDMYFGFDPFSGQEVVWQNGIAVWSMNYYGKIISPKALENNMNDFLDFLKKSLRLVKADKPFRGPAHLKDGSFEYANEVEGNIDAFKGIEKIFFEGKLVYILHYHGGHVRVHVS